LTKAQPDTAFIKIGLIPPKTRGRSYHLEELEAVNRLKQSGWTWQQIGDHMRITPTMARKRFIRYQEIINKQMPPAEKAPIPHPEMLKLVEMRATGATWEQIGCAFKITPWAATMRYHRYVKRQKDKEVAMV
jgi:hypothetical protein